MRPHQTDKFLASFDQRLHDLVGGGVKMKRVDVQSSDRTGSSKTLNGQPLGDGTKDFAIIIKVLTLELEVLDALFGLSLVSHIVLETPQLTAAKASRDDVAVGLEQRP